MKTFPQRLIFVLLPVLTISCTTNEENPLSSEQATFIPASKPIELEVLRLTNNYSVEKELSSLKQLSIIKVQTHEHTSYMIHQNSISLDNFYKRSKYLRKNTSTICIGENVAQGFSTAKSVVSAWINSKSLRKNIEGNFNYFDVPAEQNESKKWYFTNIFCRKETIKIS
ncbi:CAP domain-containing protein [Tenacibaculum sp. UWU-22]|uniref:CAP domain-containing protein n=1 Tax=Tenacibaculum sp. UWU-22 TaxID=3234187 RepID=UPI0034DAFE4D